MISLGEEKIEVVDNGALSSAARVTYKGHTKEVSQALMSGAEVLLNYHSLILL